MLSTSNNEAVAARPMRVGWRVKTWAFEVGISIASTNKLIAADEIRSVKYGAARIILTPPVEFLESLVEEAR